MSPELLFLCGVGVGLIMGLYVGERRVTKALHEMLVKGMMGGVPQAEVWEPEGDDVEPLKLVRQADGEVKAMTWDEGTIVKGVQELLMDARRLGQNLSEEEARDEVMLMLNSQDGEMG